MLFYTGGINCPVCASKRHTCGERKITGYYCPHVGLFLPCTRQRWPCWWYYDVITTSGACTYMVNLRCVKDYNFYMGTQSISACCVLISDTVLKRNSHLLYLFIDLDLRAWYYLYFQFARKLSPASHICRFCPSWKYLSKYEWIGGEMKFAKDINDTQEWTLYVF